MMDPSAARDCLYRKFKSAIERAYDMNDVLSTFWLHAVPLADFEMRAGGIHPLSADPPAAVQPLYEIDASSFQRGGFAGQDFAKIAPCCDELEAAGLNKTAEALRLYSFVAESIASGAPKSSWCQHVVEALTCQECNHEARYLFWEVINTKRRADLRSDAQAGQLRNEARCDVCYQLIQKRHFYYCDPARDEFLLFWPYGHDTGADDAIEIFIKILEKMPLEMRDGKDQILAVRGLPVTVFAEPEVAAVTLVTSHDEFNEVVNDPLLYEVEPTANMDAMDDYFAAKFFVADGKWGSAARAFARSFLKDPVRISDLINIASCLRRLDRDEEADTLLREANRLRDFLKKHRIIKRVVRRSMGSDGSGSEMHMRILQEGFPDDWGLGDMITKLHTITETENKERESAP